MQNKRFTQKGRNWLISQLAVLLIGLNAHAVRPNVVIFFADDQEANQMGFMSGKALTPSGQISSNKVLTPHLDQLARNGVLFPNHYLAATVCSPSRSALISGQYASRKAMIRDQLDYGFRYTLFGCNVPANGNSLFKVMNQAGYRVGIVGKSDGYTVGKAQANLREALAGANPDDPDRQKKIRLAYNELCSDIKTAHFADFVDGICPGNTGINWLSADYHLHNMDFVTDAALRFIDESADMQQPFLLYMPPSLLHDDAIPALLNDPERVLTYKGKLDAPLQVQPHRDDILSRCKAAGVPMENAAATWMDDALGAVLEKLERRGLLENTLIVYTSDNGGPAGKGTAYQLGCNLPLILYQKGVTESLPVCSATVSSTDVVPTILDWCGVQSPEDYRLDGRSLRPALEGHQMPDVPVMVEAANTRAVICGPWKYLAFRTPQDTLRVLPPEYRQSRLHIYQENVPGHKLNYTPMINAATTSYPAYAQPEQLYYLISDPSEKMNRAYNPEFADRLQHLKSMFTGIMTTLPGSYGEMKYEVQPEQCLDLKGDLDLTTADCALTLSDSNSFKDDEYTVITYEGKLYGRFSNTGNITKAGFNVDYSEPGQIRLIRGGSR